MSASATATKPAQVAKGAERDKRKFCADCINCKVKPFIQSVPWSATPSTVFVNKKPFARCTMKHWLTNGVDIAVALKDLDKSEWNQVARICADYEE